MNEIFGTCPLMTFDLMPNATSLQESADGVTPCGLRVGPTIDQSGRDRAPANLSAKQAKEKELLTSGTYGLHGSGSFRSVALQSSLASRLKRRAESRCWQF